MRITAEKESKLPDQILLETFPQRMLYCPEDSHGATQSNKKHTEQPGQTEREHTLSNPASPFFYNLPPNW